MGQQSASRLFYITLTKLDDTPLPVLSFKRRLSRTGRLDVYLHNLEEVRSAMYIATLVSSSSNAAESSHDVEVVVMFIARYVAQAHSLLSEEGLAPTSYAHAGKCLATCTWS